MYPILALAVIIIAILIVKRILWWYYEPRIPGEVERLHRVDWRRFEIRVFAWLAGIALVLAAVYAVQSTAPGHWWTAAISLGIGIALLVINEATASRYGVTSDAVDGAGIGILYVTCYAMHVRWDLVALWVALIAMLVVTAVALFLAARRGSFFIAILGLIGGFAAPSLLGFSDQPVELFAYLFILNIALSWLAFRMRWPLLIALSVARITIYEWTWVLQSLTDGGVWLAAVIFAAFAIVAASPFWYRPWNGYPPRFRYIAAAAVLLPLLFAFYMAANTNYGEHVNILFGFLLVIAVSLFAIVWRGGPDGLHVAGGIATMLTFGIWFWQWWSQLNAPGSWPAGPVPGRVLTIAIWTALFIALYLIRTTIFAALLFAVFIGMAFRQPQDGGTLIVAMLGLLIAVLITFIRRRDAILGAIAIAIVAKAVMVLNPLSPLFMMQVSHTLNPPPNPWLVLAAFAILFAALFALTAKLDRPVFAIVAVAFYAWMLVTVYASSTTEPRLVIATTEQLAFAIVPYAFFAVYAFRERAKAAIEPYVAFVAASLVFFLSATTTLSQISGEKTFGSIRAMLTLGQMSATRATSDIDVLSFGSIAGVIPLIEAAVLFVLLRRSARSEPRFTLLVTSALAFFNAALPFLLPKPWIAIVLAIESLVLLRLFIRDAYRGFLVWSIGLAVLLFVWITFDAGIYTWSDGYGLFAWIPWFAVAICAGAMLAGAYIAKPDMPHLRLLFSLAGLIESWYLVNVIIANLYHSTGSALNVEFMDFSAWQDVTYTIAWAVIAAVLIFPGLHCDWQGARVGATSLLLLSMAKCFLHDVIRRGDPQRIYSLIAVAISLLIVGILLQRYRVHRSAAIAV
jgi:hypothetical protein